MKLLTDYLPEKSRSAVRFVIIGALGSCLQYGLYRAFLWAFEMMYGETPILTTIAFGLGFGLEMVVNYVVTCYYTFASRPSWKNAFGFFGARVPNYLIQNGLLWLLMWMGMSNDVAGIWAIIVAGIVNYVILTFVYKK